MLQAAEMTHAKGMGPEEPNKRPCGWIPDKERELMWDEVGAVGGDWTTRSL